MSTKWPGSVHDACVFANCEVQQRFVNGSFPFFPKELIPGDECIPQLLIGDPAYPLLPYAMKEYDSCQSNEQVIFNTMLRSIRNQIECAFGRLKARWRMLNFCERNCVDIYRTTATNHDGRKNKISVVSITRMGTKHIRAIAFKG